MSRQRAKKALHAAAAIAALFNGSPSLQAAQPAEPEKALTLEQAAGKKLFKSRCLLCHGQLSTGTIMLERRLGKDKALLAQRDDLNSDYIRQIVRGGIGSMPRITRVDVTDQELLAIIAYLTRSSLSY